MADMDQLLKTRGERNREKQVLKKSEKKKQKEKEKELLKDAKKNADPGNTKTKFTGKGADALYKLGKESGQQILSKEFVLRVQNACLRALDTGDLTMADFKLLLQATKKLSLDKKLAISLYERNIERIDTYAGVEGAHGNLKPGKQLAAALVIIKKVYKALVKNSDHMPHFEKCLTWGNLMRVSFIAEALRKWINDFKADGMFKGDLKLVHSKAIWMEMTFEEASTLYMSQFQLWFPCVLRILDFTDMDTPDAWEKDDRQNWGTQMKAKIVELKTGRTIKPIDVINKVPKTGEEMIKKVAHRMAMSEDDLFNIFLPNCVVLSPTLLYQNKTYRQLGEGHASRSLTENLICTFASWICKALFTTEYGQIQDPLDLTLNSPMWKLLMKAQSVSALIIRMAKEAAYGRKGNPNTKPRGIRGTAFSFDFASFKAESALDDSDKAVKKDKESPPKRRARERIETKKEKANDSDDGDDSDSLGESDESDSDSN